MITSSVVASKLKPALKAAGIDAKFENCKYSDIPHMVSSTKVDLVIPTGKIDPSTAKGVPVVNGTAFLTGIGMQDAINQAIEILKE
jgi:PTS system galactitol-specific IIB component